MKRILSFILAALCILSLSAQTRHLRFMGIPLDGTINNFQAKLATKGFTPDVVANRSIKDPVRAFKNGTFAGEDATIYVYYNARTKNVYRAKAVIDCTDKSHLERLFAKFRDNIGEKYTLRSDFIVDKYNGYDSGSYLIYNFTYDLIIGVIDLYASDAITYPYDPSLHIDYTDRVNDLKNDTQNSEDL